MIPQKELDTVLSDEGFESKPYQDTEGVWTIGHGLTFLTEEESAHIVENFRLPAVFRDLKARHRWIASSHPEVQRVCLNMAYQLGVEGFSNFIMTIQALRNKDYARAADEMLDSKWARQTPNRAKRQADRIRALS